MIATHNCRHFPHRPGRLTVMLDLQNGSQWLKLLIIKLPPTFHVLALIRFADT